MFLSKLRIILLSIIVESIAILNYVAALKPGSEYGAVEGDDLGSSLVAQLRNDVNLDLSADEEYEDLRAELLAYHTTLAKLVSGGDTRRTFKSGTPCWQQGGICINYKLCTDYECKFQVPGCTDNDKVCCLAYRDHGISNPALSRGKQNQFGGL